MQYKKIYHQRHIHKTIYLASAYTASYYPLMPKRNHRTEEVCRCEAWPFPHRRNRDCEDAEENEAAEAADETAYQQAMWDKDRAEAIRN